MGTTACADHLHETCSFAQRLSGAQTAPRIRSKRSRFRLVPAAADGGANVELADRLELDRGTIRKWRNRFVQLHPDGLLDEPCRASAQTGFMEAPLCVHQNHRPNHRTHRQLLRCQHVFGSETGQLQSLVVTCQLRRS
jgi:hypothetical protein